MKKVNQHVNNSPEPCILGRAKYRTRQVLECTCSYIIYLRNGTLKILHLKPLSIYFLIKVYLKALHSCLKNESHARLGEIKSKKEYTKLTF